MYDMICNYCFGHLNSQVKDKWLQNKRCSFLIRQNIKKDDIIIEIQNKSVKASGEVLQIIDEVVSQGKENVLIVFYSGPNSKKYIGARLSLD